MSGPKVVRIVTREEILELCEGQLARVDAALAEWIRIGRRNDCLDEDALTAAQLRRDALAQLIRQDRFLDLQKQAPAEEAFLRGDIQTRLEAVAAEQSRARVKERRNQEAGQSLARRLRSRQVELTADLESGLLQGEAAALSKGFQLLGEQSARGASDLSKRLADGEGVQSFSSWLAQQPSLPQDPAIERLAVRIDEMASMVAPEEVATWRSRLAEAEDGEPARRNLLLDGLEIETGRALTTARARHGLLIDLQILRAEAKAAGVSLSAQDETSEQATVEDLESLKSQIQLRLDEHRARQQAAARRLAVLEGLTSLGYEVTEGMSTSLAEDGQLVLRSASRPDYGVEVSAAGIGGRMQIRPIAFESNGEGPDASRDRDAETIWCSDVSSLQADLAKNGGGLTIERALPIGATPLRRITLHGADATRRTTAPSLKTRTLD